MISTKTPPKTYGPTLLPGGIKLQESVGSQGAVREFEV